MNKDNLVSCDDQRDLKNIEFFKPIKQRAFYELDIEKIQEDKNMMDTMFTKQTEQIYQ